MTDSMRAPFQPRCITLADVLSSSVSDQVFNEMLATVTEAVQTSAMPAHARGLAPEIVVFSVDAAGLGTRRTCTPRFEYWLEENARLDLMATLGRDLAVEFPFGRVLEVALVSSEVQRVENPDESVAVVAGLTVDDRFNFAVPPIVEEADGSRSVGDPEQFVRWGGPEFTRETTPMGGKVMWVDIDPTPASSWSPSAHWLRAIAMPFR
jgi:hypothetical protein